MLSRPWAGLAPGARKLQLGSLGALRCRRFASRRPLPPGLGMGAPAGDLWRSYGWVLDSESGKIHPKVIPK